MRCREVLKLIVIFILFTSSVIYSDDQNVPYQYVSPLPGSQNTIV
jgi:hypothetical protein